MKRNTSVSALIAVIVTAILVASPVQGSIVRFHNITNNRTEDLSGQLSVDVTAEGVNQVKFTFDNVGPIPSIICAIYFGDGTLLGSNATIDSSDHNRFGVAFEAGANPPDLPGATQDYKTHQFFASDANDPGPKYGVDASIEADWVSFVFDLKVNEDGVRRTFNEVLTGITNPTDANHVYIGLKIQSIGGDNGGSDSYVNDVENVPEPATVIIWSLLSGLGFAWFKMRK